MLVAAIVVGGLAAFPVPVFLEQREEAARSERLQLVLSIRKPVNLYERVGEFRGAYPETGVYTEERPVKGFRGCPSISLGKGVTITTKTTSQDNFEVKGENTSLSGTFVYSYDSASGKYSGPLSPER